MPIKERIAGFEADLVAWRRDLHAHPELGFEEHRTAAVVAEKLETMGIAVHRGLAGTGVVGSLGGRFKGNRAIALRADMDALAMPETNQFAHASTHAGRMHACGHDGHTAMLLGAARYLAETRDFAGTVHFVFQPAEEGKGGGLAMVEGGLFDLFPAEEVYGLHNWPGLPFGMLAGRVGPIMAATDRIEIVVQGQGGHAARPQFTIDPVVVGAQIVMALQTVVSRSTDPLKSIVVTISQFHAGTADNVIPDEARLGGTLRSFDADLRRATQARIAAIASGVAASFGATATVTIHPGYPATVNDADALKRAMAAAERVVGPDLVDTDVAPSMGAEDFSYMLQAKPGAYIFLGSTDEHPARQLHTTSYDFDDRLLAIGASYWAELTELVLAPPGVETAAR